MMRTVRLDKIFKFLAKEYLKRNCSVEEEETFWRLYQHQKRVTYKIVDIPEKEAGHQLAQSNFSLKPT